MEVWRTIAGLGSYAVSFHGRVKRLTSATCAKAGHILKPSSRGGRSKARSQNERYLFVNLCRGRHRSNSAIQVLVWRRHCGTSQS